MSLPFDDTIQSILYISDQIFESIFTPSDQIYEKQREILNWFREPGPSESYKHIIPNTQEIFRKTDKIFEQQQEYFEIMIFLQTT